MKETELEEAGEYFKEEFGPLSQIVKILKIECPCCRTQLEYIIIGRKVYLLKPMIVACVSGTAPAK